MLFVLANLISGSRGTLIGKERVVRFPRKWKSWALTTGFLRTSQVSYHHRSIKQAAPSELNQQVVFCQRAGGNTTGQAKTVLYHFPVRNLQSRNAGWLLLLGAGSAAGLVFINGDF